MGLQLSQDQIPLKSETEPDPDDQRMAALTVVQLAGYDADRARPVLEALGLAEVTRAVLWPCTTLSYGRRHLSDCLTGSDGQSGYALCYGPSGVRVEVFDQTFMDREHARWTRKAPKQRISELPVCRKCDGKAAKLTGRGGGTDG